MKYWYYLLLFNIYTLGFAQIKTDPNKQSSELGKVSWYRDFIEATQQAKKENKDIVLLFQEVPGCATCRNYGQNVFTHPLMVEALENEFISLVIFNNRSGKDRIVLNQYNEPSWNNPVVRIISPNGNTIVNRISNDYEALTLCNRMIEALLLREKQIPEYLNLLQQELEATTNKSIRDACYSMYCFWSGEKELGNIDGVLNVTSGFIDHKEVVKVNYDSQKINETALTQKALEQQYNPISSLNDFRISKKDVHYYLRNSLYQYLPLSELQKIKINSALGNHASAEIYLSPKQKKWLTSAKARKLNKSLIDVNILEAWYLF